MHAALKDKTAFIPIVKREEYPVGRRTGGSILVPFAIYNHETDFIGDDAPDWAEFVRQCRSDDDVIGAIRLEFDGEGNLETLRDVTDELGEAIAKDFEWEFGATGPMNRPHPLAETYVQDVDDAEREAREAVIDRQAEGTW